jgi:hypothetical protein
VEAAVSSSQQDDQHDQIICGYAPRRSGDRRSGDGQPDCTVASVRTIFSKNSGNQGATGSVAFHSAKWACSA